MAHDPSVGLSKVNPEPVLVQIEPSTINDQKGRSSRRKFEESIAMSDINNESQEPLNNQRPVQVEDDISVEERQGLKLGLGDFVFYSVLVGRASLSDWVVTVGSVFAVLSGLVLTILILVLKRRPLPALPISIFLGITVFLVGTLTLVPLIEDLIIFNDPGSSLRAGIASAQLVYL